MNLLISGKNKTKYDVIIDKYSENDKINIANNIAKLHEQLYYTLAQYYIGIGYEDK